MRVLVVHNRYKSGVPSGENRVVSDEVESLLGTGIDVERFMPSSDAIDAMGPIERGALALRPTYSGGAARTMRRCIEVFRPDVVHVHNVFPLLSPWVVRTAVRAGVPVVHTVHNYRHACASGTLYRDGAPCTECVGKSVPWPAVVHGCYRGSRAQSLAMTAASVAHIGTWHQVSRFLATSEFVSDHLVAIGVPLERIVVKPNAVRDPGPSGPPRGGFLFAGRLDVEKGATLLLQAWSDLAPSERPELVLVGDGPERDTIVEFARDHAGVRYEGPVPPARVSQLLLRENSVAVIPSRWQEPFGLVAIEAFAHGRPVIATDVGGLSELVDDSVGWRVQPSRDALTGALRRALATPPDELDRLGRAARARFEQRYSAELVLAQLLAVYEDVVSRSPAAS